MRGYFLSALKRVQKLHLMYLSVLFSSTLPWFEKIVAASSIV